MLINDFLQKIDNFISYLSTERQASFHTQKSYKIDLEQFALFWQSIEKEKSEIFDINQMAEQFNLSLHNSTIHFKSIARKMSCLNSFKKYLKKHHNIIIGAVFKRPYIKQSKPEILDLGQISHLMDTTSEHDMPTKHPLRDKAIIELIYATGIRCSELVDIELQNINFQNNSIIIRAKNKKERIVLFGTKANQRMQEYISKERIEPFSNTEKLFLNYLGKPITVRSIQRICNMFALCFADKLKLTPYILRHSFAAHMLTNGANLESVQELLGHKTRASTERYIQNV